ncbi:GNAT family N-acetyltransferase [Streptomyces sp. WZ.A104]|uniref:GNAT family N-acetyltransferase n=1 Tax=Streptomyces sp. WZ.A104 TaxID=2023771 RepID=UPI000BBCBC25|nr:GNAT family N-acetyltransferase [Streptomyces sp. WZ.A104]PCG85249.1 GNAT family N-acetyltransferase [Streptomyces sp. WZ.A104]
MTARSEAKATVRIAQPIRTDRLLLRPFTPGDEADMWDFESRPEVARYLFNEPRGREDNARELTDRCTRTSLTQQGDVLVLAVEHEGRVIGWTQLIWLDAAARQGEFGYVLHPAYQGRGLAGEAAVEMLRIGFERMGLHRIIGRCEARNTASARLMERLGLRKEAEFTDSLIFKGDWGSECVYAMLAAEWCMSRWRASR